MHSARVYRALLRCYPGRFRREYADAMTQCFTDRARRDGAASAWGVALRDLSISAPNEHWEAFVHASSQSKLVITAIVTTVLVVVALAFGGLVFGLVPVLLLLLAWQLYAIHRSRGARFTGVRWWSFVVAGAGVLAVLFVVFALPWPQSWRSSFPDELAFWIVFLGIPLGLVLIATGALVAFGQLLERRRRPAA